MPEASAVQNSLRLTSGLSDLLLAPIIACVPNGSTEVYATVKAFGLVVVVTMQAGKRSFAHVFYCLLIRSSRGALTTVKLAIVGMAHHNRSLTLCTLAAYRPSLPAKIIQIGTD